MTAILEVDVKDNTAMNPVENLGEPAQTITYPISVDYVKQWSLVRALSEAVANAIDADPYGFSVSYDDATQELRIEDSAEGGMGVESMIFGWSDKTGRDDVIGQFGEGLKIATIRAVSDKTVRYMLIESVGMRIVPAVVDHAAMSVLDIPNRSKKSPQVLAWNLYPSERGSGTLLRVGVKRAVYEEIVSRFRHLTTPGYISTDVDTVIPHSSGNIYIGGVLVSNIPELLYGYDFSFGTAKAFQNRDRTVLDNRRLQDALRRLGSSIEDKNILTGWVKQALAGTLSDYEKGFITGNRAHTVREKKMWQEIAQATLPDVPENFFYREGFQDNENALSLTDGNLTELSPKGNLSSYEFANLMGFVGVKSAKNSVPETKQKEIIWMKGKLRASEQKNLDDAISTIRKFFGDNAIDKVRVYEEIDANAVMETCSTTGFYNPTSGLIAVKRSELADEKRAWEILYHEAAHRIAHKQILDPYVYQYADRTRGYEDTLVQMGTAIARHYAFGVDLPAPKKQEPFFVTYASDFHEVPSSTVWSFSRTQKATTHPASRARESVFSNRIRAVFTVAFEEWVTSGAGKNAKDFERQTLVSSSTMHRMMKGVIPTAHTMERLTDVCAPLGINSGIVWWAIQGMLAPSIARKKHTLSRKFSAKNKAQALIARDAVLTDPRLAHLEYDMNNIIAGNAGFDWDSDAWFSGIEEMVETLEGAFPASALEDALSKVGRPSNRLVDQAWHKIEA